MFTCHSCSSRDPSNFLLQFRSTKLNAAPYVSMRHAPATPGLCSQKLEICSVLLMIFGLHPPTSIRKNAANALNGAPSILGLLVQTVQVPIEGSKRLDGLTLLDTGLAWIPVWTAGSTEFHTSAARSPAGRRISPFNDSVEGMWLIARSLPEKTMFCTCAARQGIAH